MCLHAPGLKTELIDENFGNFGLSYIEKLLSSCLCLEQQHSASHEVRPRLLQDFTLHLLKKKKKNTASHKKYGNIYINYIFLLHQLNILITASKCSYAATKTGANTVAIVTQQFGWSQGGKTGESYSSHLLWSHI